jgi:Ca2+-binding RTX toxin-like protein
LNGFSEALFTKKDTISCWFDAVNLIRRACSLSLQHREGVRAMCIVCQAQVASSGYAAVSYDANGHVASGQGATSTIGASGTANVDALLSGYKWSSTSLTFALPSSTAAYTGYSAAFDETGSFMGVSGQMATAVRQIMSHIGDVSGLSITETTAGSTANIRVGRSWDADPAHAYLPTGYFKGGDVWLSRDSEFNSAPIGSYAYSTVLHELGHALGLKHSHTYIGGIGVYYDDIGVINAPLATAWDSPEFTVMSYRSYVGQDLVQYSYYTNEDYGFSQSLMMLDIAALQKMYGPDFTSNSGNTVYTFSSSSGAMSIDGVSQGTPGANRVFRTIWDGGGTDTYDFSNYTTNMRINLQPGEWSTLSTTQLANLGMGNYARGNVANAMLFEGDLRSLIENAVGGSGADSIVGNVVDNVLTGNGGSDSLYGFEGNDTLRGGAGADSLNGGDGDDVLFTDGLDVIVGGSGFDTLTFDNGLAFRNFAMAASGIERIVGSEFGDAVTITYNATSPSAGGAATIVEYAYDNAGTASTWSFYQNTYSATWQLALQQFVEDNGGARNVAYDITNTETFQYYQNTYNSQNQLLTQQILDDNGNQRVVGYDVANTQTYASYVNTYDTQGRLTIQQIADDNGNNRIVGYDVDNLYSWAFYQNTYNAQGQLIDTVFG